LDGDEDRAPSKRALALSERQQTAVAAALTILSTVVIIAAVAILVWLAGAFLRRFSSVFLPLAVGGIAALVFRPYFQWLRLKLKLPAWLALVAVFVSILAPLAAFAWFFGALAVDQISDMVTRFPEWWDKQVASAKERWPEVREFVETNPWVQRIKGALEGQGGAMMAALQAVGGRALSAGRGIVGAVGGFVAWIMLPVYFAFFLLAGKLRPRALESYLPFLKPETRKDAIYLITEFINIVVSFFRGQLIVAFLQGLLFAIGFSLVGLKYGFVLGLVLGFLNIIPYLGSMIGLGIGIPLAWFQEGGGHVTVLLVLLVFTIVQVIEGNLLTPKIMGDRTGLHPMAIIVAVFFWGSALQGIFGMILAIPLTAFLVVFWRLAKEKYIGELV
jgi:predicted PurR-regulated permease PerM